MQFERRFLSGSEVRVAGSGKLEGYAAVFNSLSEDLGGFREEIKPGAFARAVRSQDVRALFNHDPNIVLGRTKSGTLRISEDSRGLHYEVDLPDTQAARDLRASIQRGDITGSSFGFRAVKDAWFENGRKRALVDVDLFDVSPVAYPAYQQSSVSARSLGWNLKPEEVRVGIYTATRSVLRAPGRFRSGDPTIDRLSDQIEKVKRQFDGEEYFNPFIGPSTRL